MSFKPERFLKSDNHEPEVDPREFVFGYGRRVCPGRQLAEQSVWLLCATSLATLSVSKKTSNDGRILEPTVEYVGHLITYARHLVDVDDC
jgi:cytochrome P450